MDNNSGYTKKEGQGSLFKNDKKTSPNQPDFTGSVVVGGVEKRLAAWNRTARNGSTYLSISISDFQGGQQQGSGQGGYGQRSSYGSQGGYASRQQQYGAPQQSAPAPGIEDMPADFGGDMPF